MPGTLELLEATVEGLQYELRVRDLRLAEQGRRIKALLQQVEELKSQARSTVSAVGVAGRSDRPFEPPSFVKPNLPRRRRRQKPGRKAGHAAALRAMPRRIDRHQDVGLETDERRRAICPRCRCRLGMLRRHKRIVEDLIRSTVGVTCYHTQSGRCPRCDARVESRAPGQPPAANVPHGQLGINALTTAAILRIRHRMPFRQIVQLLADLPGLRVSAGAIVKQIKRLAKWLEGKYQDLIRRMRAGERVHVDETGWRIDGRNFWLWAFTDPTFTLYHVDESRGGKVPLKLLGKAFDGTVIADFYGGYNRLDAPKQRCLTHLMREVRELREQDAGFADCPLSRRLMRWCREALRLKKHREELEVKAYERKALRLEDRLDKLATGRIDGLIGQEYEHADAKRLCKRLSRHRAELTRFLWDDKLDGTNNAAERALRPAVVMRKITGGNRSQSAAQAWAKLASLLRTADQHGLGVYDATQKLILEHWAEGTR